MVRGRLAPPPVTVPASRGACPAWAPPSTVLACPAPRPRALCPSASTQWRGASFLATGLHLVSALSPRQSHISVFRARPPHDVTWLGPSGLELCECSMDLVAGHLDMSSVSLASRSWGGGGDRPSCLSLPAPATGFTSCSGPPGGTGPCVLQPPPTPGPPSTQSGLASLPVSRRRDAPSSGLPGAQAPSAQDDPAREPG